MRSAEGEGGHTCLEHARSTPIRIDDYESPQIELLYRDLLVRYPSLTPDTLFCREDLEEIERSMQRRQIVRYNGGPQFVDLTLGEQPILPTVERVHAREEFRGRGVTIAFVDSAFAPHPELILPVNRVQAVYDAVAGREIHDFERGLYEAPSPEAWHGTMAASVAAGSGFLSHGLYRGIASEAKVILIRTMTPERRIGTEQVQRALRWIVDNRQRLGIDIVNLSVGVDEVSRSMRHPVIALVERLVADGVIVVAAAGNTPSRPIVPPASAPSAITVGGYNDNNTHEWRRRELWHSSWGETHAGTAKPELLGPAIWVAAPILLRTGVKSEAEALFTLADADDDSLMSLIPVLAPETGIARALHEAGSPLRVRALVLERIRAEKQINADYKHVDGTSFSAPIVASVAAQMLEADPSLTPAEVKRALTETAEPLPGIPVEVQGAGVIRPDRALDRILANRRRKSR